MKVEFSGVVRVNVPDHMSERDGLNVAAALAKVFVTASHEGNPSLAVLQNAEASYIATAEDKARAEDDFLTADTVGIKGEWTVHGPPPWMGRRQAVWCRFGKKANPNSWEIYVPPAGTPLTVKLSRKWIIAIVQRVAVSMGGPMVWWVHHNKRPHQNGGHATKTLADSPHTWEELLEEVGRILGQQDVDLGRAPKTGLWNDGLMEVVSENQKATNGSG